MTMASKEQTASAADSDVSLGEVFVAVTGETTIIEPQDSIDRRNHDAATDEEVALSEYLLAMTKEDGLWETIDQPTTEPRG